jgi:hypothetical protein
MGVPANRRGLDAECDGHAVGKTGRKKGITRLKPRKRFRGFKFVVLISE